MKKRLTFILMCVILSSCATIQKRPENSHYYCVLDLHERGVSAETANKVCVSIFRQEKE